MRRTAFFLGTAAAILSAQTTSSAADSPASPVSFTKDVAPILYASCAGCHRPGEVARCPSSRTKRCGPGRNRFGEGDEPRDATLGGDPHFGTFKDDRSLSEAQIHTIAAWVDAGAPKGRDADLPPVAAVASGWSRGEPERRHRNAGGLRIPAEGEVR